jgi:hypothetical protein
MLKARANDYIFLGLSEVNVQRLREGKPIRAELADLGVSGTVIIFYGETEDKMREDLIEFIGPGTVVKDDRPKDS